MDYETLLRKTSEFWSVRLERAMSADEVERLLKGPDFLKLLHAWGRDQCVEPYEPHSTRRRRGRLSGPCDLA